MAGKEIVPQLGLDSYSCPHCGALAHQFWFEVYPNSIKRGSKPTLASLADIKEYAAMQREKNEDQRRANEQLARFLKNDVTHEVRSRSTESHWCMFNMFMSLCHSCDGFAIWIKNQL